MAADEITRFPISHRERINNRRGPRAVSCEVTDRWLRFNKASRMNDGRSLVFVDVMTDSADDVQRKLCEVCLDMDQLIELASKIRDEESSDGSR
tara:strand:+ start:660 stop:941 length:282 start_codon:yes stop_codon:yes gene_type:complete